MIAILSDRSVGGTFLNWTLYYLSGHTHYWNCLQNQSIELTDQPLTQSNAHNFRPNHPTTLKEFQNIIKFFPDKDDQFSTIYVNGCRDPDETRQVIDVTQSIADNFIFLTQSNSSELYHCRYHGRSNKHLNFTTSGYSNDSDERWNDFVDYFFAESKKKWQELNLTQIWDKREFIALNIDTTKSPSPIRPFLNYSIPHYHIDVFDLWNMFDALIPDLFKNLKLPIDESRFEHWLSVYREWQKIHRQQQRFMWYFERIIDYILGGYDMDLESFGLDVMQEAAIQRELIYRHNLNLKTWQLEKFQNTQQLHKLLEPNFHLLN
jgi:hypothetical protein